MMNNVITRHEDSFVFRRNVFHFLHLRRPIFIHPVMSLNISGLVPVFREGGKNERHRCRHV